MAENIKVSDIMPAPPERLYSAWLDPHEHTKMTGGEATDEGGGRFTAWDGYITGRTVSAVPHSQDRPGVAHQRVPRGSARFHAHHPLRAGGRRHEGDLHPREHPRRPGRCLRAGLAGALLHADEGVLRLPDGAGTRSERADHPRGRGGHRAIRSRDRRRDAVRRQGPGQRAQAGGQGREGGQEGAEEGLGPDQGGGQEGEGPGHQEEEAGGEEGEGEGQAEGSAQEEGEGREEEEALSPAGRLRFRTERFAARHDGGSHFLLHRAE